MVLCDSSVRNSEQIKLPSLAPFPVESTISPRSGCVTPVKERSVSDEFAAARLRARALR